MKKSWICIWIAVFFLFAGNIHAYGMEIELAETAAAVRYAADQYTVERYEADQYAAGRYTEDSADIWSASEMMMGAEEFRVEEIQKFLHTQSSISQIPMSFQEMMEAIAGGHFLDVFEACAVMIRQSLFSELSTNVGLMGQVVVLALIGAVFSACSDIFGSGHVSENGFYVVYLLTMTFLAASFFASADLAAEVTWELVRFMNVLLPAYFMAAAAAGSAFTSASICGVTMGAVGLVQTILAQFLIPLTRVYMMMVLAGNLYKEDMISKLTGFLGTVIVWTLKTMFGAIIGFHVIQGMVLPQADAVRNASTMKLVQMFPGIGAGIGAVSQMVLGSGILIKNTVGVAAVVILLVLAAVPIVKLLILMALYYLAAAVMQPVCDKRLVSCLTGAAVGHGILLKIVGYSLALFGVTIAVLCISTNAVWYVG